MSGSPEDEEQAEQDQAAKTGGDSFWSWRTAGKVIKWVVGASPKEERDLSRASIVSYQDDPSVTSRANASRRSSTVSSQDDPEESGGEESEDDEEESKRDVVPTGDDESKQQDVHLRLEGGVGPDSGSDHEQEEEADLPPADEKSQKTPLLNKKLPGPFARFFAVPWRRNLVILFVALLVGAGVALLVHFVFPAAVLSFAAYVGITGPFAPILPLLVLGLACAFLTAGILSFPALKQMLFKQEAEGKLTPAGFSMKTWHRYYEVEDQLFMIRLLGVSVIIAGIGLGVFMAATLPAVFTFLSFGLTGLAALILSSILAAIISFAVIAVIAYLLYRGSGMQERHAVLVRELVEMQATANAMLGINQSLEEAQNLACPSQSGKKANYVAAASAFSKLAANLDCEKLGIVEVIQWQLKLVKLCQGTEDYRETASTLCDALLIELADKIKDHDPSEESEGYGYWKEAFGFCLKLAKNKETSPLWESWDENEMTSLGSQYAQLESNLSGFSDKGEPIGNIREVLDGIYQLLSPQDKRKHQWMVQRGGEAERASALHRPGAPRGRVDSEESGEFSFEDPVGLQRSAALPPTSNKQQGRGVHLGQAGTSTRGK